MDNPRDVSKKMLACLDDNLQKEGCKVFKKKYKKYDLGACEPCNIYVDNDIPTCPLCSRQLSPCIISSTAVKDQQMISCSNYFYKGEKIFVSHITLGFDKDKRG